MFSKYRISLLLLLILIFSFNLISDTEDTYLFDKDLMNYLPSAYFYSSFIENYSPDMTLLIEESNGFSFLDRMYVYFEGDSFNNFKWNIDEFNINSVLFSGSPSIILPISMTRAFKVKGKTPLNTNKGFYFLTDNSDFEKNELFVSSIIPNAGGVSPLYSIMIPHHPFERDEMLYYTRRSFKENYLINYHLKKRISNKTNLELGFDYFKLSRNFNDFNNFSDFDKQFNDNSQFFSFGLIIKKQGKLSYDFENFVNYKKRSNSGAETGRLIQETFEQNYFSVFSGLNIDFIGIKTRLSIQYENSKNKPFDESIIYKDLKDNDGSEFYINNFYGDFKTYKFNLNIDKEIDIKHYSIKPYLNFEYFDISSMFSIVNNYAYLFDNAPYLVYKWHDVEDDINSNLYLKTGINLGFKINKNVSLLFDVFYKQSNLYVKESELKSSGIGVDGGLFFNFKRTRLLISYAVIPYEFTSNYNLFLQNQPYSEIYYWNDVNNDKKYQDGEEGALFGYSGFHYLSNDLKNPYYKRFLIEYNMKLSEKFRLRLKGLYKKIYNNIGVRFNDDYGFYNDINGYDIWFYDKPFKEFYLYNINDLKNPFYAEFLINLYGKGNRWYFNFSFLAHIGMGYTPFGNGVINDYGELDESQANPNSMINYYGRVDGDRGFLGKIYYVYKFSDRLSLGVSLKYRDGDPFAFINSVYAYNQYALYYSTIQAENEKGKKGGPREDYIADFSIKLSYILKLFNKKIKLGLSILNLLDSGAALSEYAFSSGERLPVELQIPRTIRFDLLIPF